MTDSFRSYLQEIGRIPLLTAAEEIDLGHKIQRMLAIKEAKPDGNFTPEERRAVRTGTRAHSKMVSANLRLVVNVAKKYRRMAENMDISDLVQEGSIGLHRAVDKYDPERGYKFSTYAYWWIRQGITRAVNMTDRTIRLPIGANDALRKARSFALEYHVQYGRAPSVERIAEQCNCTAATLADYLAHSGGVTSLDTAAFLEEGSSLHELVASDEKPIEEVVENLADLEALHDALNRLNEADATVIREYFGIGGVKKTLTEIGQMHGHSRERARQRKEKALRKLQFQLSMALPSKYRSNTTSSSMNWSLRSAA